MANIFEMLRQKEDQSRRNAKKGVIINPGAIGDCILTLPLAKVMIEKLGLGSVDFLGNTSYIDFYPGRTCIDSIRSINSIKMHKLFFDHKTFAVDEHDPLISAFSRYQCVTSLMGWANDNFMKNLIFTVNCARSADVYILDFTPSKNYKGHISDYYIEQFLQENGKETDFVNDKNKRLITPRQTDIEYGRDYLESVGFDIEEQTVILHPGSGSQDKCWHLKNYLKLAGQLVDNDIQVLFLVGPAENERFDDIQMQNIATLSGCVSVPDLSEVLQIISASSMFIGNDSGITHLAGACGIPTMAIFGPTNPDFYRPIGPHAHVFTPPINSFSELDNDAVDASVQIAFKILND